MEIVIPSVSSSLLHHTTLRREYNRRAIIVVVVVVAIVFHTYGIGRIWRVGYFSRPKLKYSLNNNIPKAFVLYRHTVR